MAAAFRPLVAGDLPFLRSMLYAALFWRPDPEALPVELVLAHPKVAIYHEGWGRPGDAGFVAGEGGEDVGAVWCRLFTEAEHGDGFLDAETPELAIAVVEHARGRGIGRALMEAMHAHARAAGVRRISLSVNADNPARHLYLALGYRDLEPDDPRERMLCELTPPG